MRIKDGVVWLEALSRGTAETDFPITKDDVDENIEGKLGEIIDLQYQQLRKAGAFEGEQLVGTGRYHAVRDGVELHGMATYTGIALGPGEGLVRVDTQVSGRGVDRALLRDMEALDILPAKRLA